MKGQPKLRLVGVPKRDIRSLPDKEAPVGLKGADRCRHVLDPRVGREGFYLCGCAEDNENDRKPLDPENYDDLDYMIDALLGCQRCLKIWVTLFL